MKRLGCVFAVAAGVAGWLEAAVYTTQRLNDWAVRDGSGQIIVYGTDGSYNDNPSLTKEAAFDGDTTTFFDPSSAAVAGPCWAGFELETPKMITRVRFFPRDTYPDRLVGCLIQGANTVDFSDAVTLHTITAARANAWGDETMSSPESMQAFRYVRIYGPTPYVAGGPLNGSCCGNVAEIEFYGSDLPGEEMRFPDPPEIGFADCINGQMNFRLATVENTLIYQIQRKNADAPDSAFADCLTFGYPGAVASYYRFDPTPVSVPTVYRVRALNTLGASDWIERTITPRPFLRGTWIGVAGSWGNSGATGDKVFDGNIATFYDPENGTGNGGWTGCDFGEERVITGLAYVPRENYADRMLHGTFQFATRPDFADAEVFFAVTEAPGYDAVTLIDLATPVTARYVRFQSGAEVWCNVAEIEWRPPMTELEQPPPLTVSISDMSLQNAVLTWETPAPRIPCDTIAVLRGKGPGGPWIDISPADISLATTTHTDTDISGYEGWYYTLAYRKTVDGVSHLGPVSDPAFFRRGHKLPVATVNGYFQNGMAGLTDGTPYQGNSAVGPAAMFDGDTSTFVDIVPAAVRAGVDLAEPYGISFARIFPRANIVGRPNGCALWASNDGNDWTAGVQISPAVTITTADWVLTTVNSPERWRYVYLYKDSDFYANVSELELYGWTLADIADDLTAPQHLAATCTAEALTLTWDEALNAECYFVERKVGQQEEWILIGEATEPRFVDPSVNLQGLTHAYRVTAVRGDEQACSATLELVPYVTGNGTGLYATYYANRTFAYNPDETVAATRVEPTINFSWGAGGPLEGVTDYFGAVWTGKLIVPLPGVYTFTLEVDDGAAIRIDGEFVYNAMAAVGTHAIYLDLTAGEHDIRIDYLEITGQAYCRLAWDGPVGKGPIPTSQLIPVPPEDLPEPWIGERTVGNPQMGYTRFNNDGSLTIGAAGIDYFGANEGYHGIWQETAGNFCYTLKYRFDSLESGATKAMLQIRGAPFGSAPALAPCVMLRTTDEGDPFYAYNLKFRAIEGGDIEDDAGGWVAGASDTGWLRVKRIGPVFSCYTRTEDDGKWILRYAYEDVEGAFGDTLYVGPAVSRNGTAVLDSVTYSRITLTPADPGVLVILR